MRRRRTWVWGLIIAAVLAGSSFLFLEGRDAAEPSPEAPASEPLAGAEFSEARIVGRHRGERQWVVDTALVREEAEDRVRAEGVDSGTLYRDGSPYLDLQALQALSHRVTNDLTLEGDVVAVHVDGAVFRTERLEWLASAERLIAPGRVTIEREGETVEAQRMEVESSQDMVYLYDDVLMQRESGEWLRADRVDYEIDGEDFWVRGSFRAAIPSQRKNTEEGNEQ